MVCTVHPYTDVQYTTLVNHTNKFTSKLPGTPMLLYMGDIALSAYSAKNWSHFLEVWVLRVTTFHIVGPKLACSLWSILRVE